MVSCFSVLFFCCCMVFDLGFFLILIDLEVISVVVLMWIGFVYSMLGFFFLYCCGVGLVKL